MAILYGGSHHVNSSLCIEPPSLLTHLYQSLYQSLLVIKLQITLEERSAQLWHPSFTDSNELRSY